MRTKARASGTPRWASLRPPIRFERRARTDGPGALQSLLGALPIYSPPLSGTTPPPRPPPVGLDDSCWSKEQIRAAERKREEACAVDAILTYMQTHSISPRTSRSSSLQHLDTTCLSVVDEGADGRARSSSIASTSTSSSRPRTNESLPSYHSHSSSPVSDRWARRPSATPVPLPSTPDAVAQPRSYDFI
jgi:hypothetical protein